MTELDGPECGMAEAAPWLALAAGTTLGLALTAGWVARAFWTIARDPRARQVAGWPW